jgi:hypothetical protein
VDNNFFRPIHFNIKISIWAGIDQGAGVKDIDFLVCRDTIIQRYNDTIKKEV